MDLPADVEAELGKAEQARARGNEGQARVCARRAAGLAAREYLSRRGPAPRTSSAYDLLKLIAEDAGIHQALRESASRLTLRVDEEFKLPPGMDLIEEARLLCSALLSNPRSSA